MDVDQLIAFLSPFLAPLLFRTEEAVSNAVTGFGEAAWQQAAKLWERLRGGVEERPAAREAVQDVAAEPDSSGAKAALKWQLEKLLAADPALGEDLARLWQQGVAAGVTVTTVTASGERSVAVGGDVSGGSISTGDRHIAPPETG
jgi:hypothetical protein